MKAKVSIIAECPGCGFDTVIHVKEAKFQRKATPINCVCSESLEMPLILVNSNPPTQEEIV